MLESGKSVSQNVALFDPLRCHPRILDATIVAPRPGPEAQPQAGYLVGRTDASGKTPFPLSSARHHPDESLRSYHAIAPQT